MNEIKALKETKFDATTTLLVIEQDKDLTSIFRDENTLDFSILHSIIKKGILGEDTTAFLVKIFEKIILTKKEHLGKYLSLQTNTPIIIKSPESTKKPSLVPRRYGKEKIQKDIEKQGGKPTPLQNAMLSVNNLKNIYVNLSARGIKDMVGGTNLLSDTDCRDIVAVISTVERKLETILKRKK